MKIIFIGCVEFSANCLRDIIKNNYKVVGVCTLEKSNFNSDFYNLSPICIDNNIPYLYSDDINCQKVIDWLEALSPDIIFCFGWSKLLSKKILDIPPLGVLGYHPASLPQNRGRHPIIWALALGLNYTASTFFFMDESADGGDILSQEYTHIDYEDNAHTLYQKLTQIAIKQLHDFLPLLVKGTFKRIPQDNTISNNWRKRSPKDGLIDWRMSSDSIRNLIRALTYPYDGASFLYKGREYKAWSAHNFILDTNNIEPGKVLEVSSSGLLIKCGLNAIRIVDFEPNISLKEGEYL